MIKKEAEDSVTRSHICVVNHPLEPRSSQDVAELFGWEGQKGYNGIHLCGRLGAEMLFKSLSTIIQEDIDLQYT